MTHNRPERISLSSLCGTSGSLTESDRLFSLSHGTLIHTESDLHLLKNGPKNQPFYSNWGGAGPSMIVSRITSKTIGPKLIIRIYTDAKYINLQAWLRFFYRTTMTFWAFPKEAQTPKSKKRKNLYRCYAALIQEITTYNVFHIMLQLPKAGYEMAPRQEPRQCG